MSGNQQESVPVERVKFNTDIVTLVVGGQDLQEIAVHADLLCQSSPVLKASLKREWDQDASRTLRFPDDKPNVVGFYVEWLYSEKKIPVPPLAQKSEKISNYQKMVLLFRAFAWGEKMQDNCFKDAMMDAFLNIAKPANGSLWNFLNYELITMAYETTPDGSPFRRLLVDIFVNRSGSFQPDAQYRLNLPAEFIVSVLNGYIALRAKVPKLTLESGDPTQGNNIGCSYHHHAKNETCSQQTGK